MTKSSRQWLSDRQICFPILDNVFPNWQSAFPLRVYTLSTVSSSDYIHLTLSRAKCRQLALAHQKCRNSPLIAAQRPFDSGAYVWQPNCHLTSAEMSERKDMLAMHYTVERVHAPCGTRKAVVFRLTCRREWRPEVQQWCDVKVSEQELGPAETETKG